MYRYYLSILPNEFGIKIVHILFCKHGVEPPERENLGFHLSCRTALEAARSKYKDERISGCEHCCPECSDT